MSTATLERPKAAIEYPDSDGEPMAENTQQLRRIVTIHGNCSAIFMQTPDVFVAMDNLIYPEEGNPRNRAAPDVYVAFGRPKGDRGSYRVWEEDDIFPQVIFEVLSPGNRYGEMIRKHEFYERYGAEEYYVDDIDHNWITGYLRDPRTDKFIEIPEMNGFVSPRLGVRFEVAEDEVALYRPDGKRFISFEELEQERVELERSAAAAMREAKDATRNFEAASRQVEVATREAEDATRRADKLAAKLRALGVDPDLNGDSS